MAPPSAHNNSGLRSLHVGGDADTRVGPELQRETFQCFSANNSTFVSIKDGYHALPAARVGG